MYMRSDKERLCSKKIGGGKLTLSNHTGRALLAALLLTGAFCVPVEAAAERSEPLTVTDKNQKVSDDFKNVSIVDGKTPAILEIASTAAADDKGVTTVNSKIINGTFTVTGTADAPAEANGIWVQDNYPGTVKLADGLNINVEAVGNQYNSSGIYLEGVDTHHGKPDESVAANQAYTANGKISNTTVKMGNNTAISVTASTPEGQQGTYVNANALENHFGHMTVGDHVTLSTKTGAFRENYSNGFFQLFYGQTSIGNHFTSTICAKVAENTSRMRIAALRSSHDHETDKQMPAIAQNRLFIGDDASLQTVIDVDSPQGKEQDLDIAGAFLYKTDFSIGNRLKVDVSQSGSGYNPKEENAKDHAVDGIYTSGAEGIVGEGLQNTVIVKNSYAKRIHGIYLVNQSDLHMGQNAEVSIVQNGGHSDLTYGLSEQNQAKASFGDKMHIHLNYMGNGENSGQFGVYTFTSSITLGNNSEISVVSTNTSSQTSGSSANGIRNTLSDATFGNNLMVQVQANDYEAAEGIRNAGVDSAPAKMTIGDDMSVAVKLSGNGPSVEGIRNGTKNHDARYTFTDEKNTILTVGKNAHITVTAPDKVTDVSALHSFNHADAKIGDGAVLTVNSHAQNSKDRILNNVVKADDAGHIIFDGGMTLSGSQNAIYSTGDGSSVTALGGGRKVILGDLESANKGSIQLNLNTGDSYMVGDLNSASDGSIKLDLNASNAYLRGKSTVVGFNTDASGNTEMTVANGARWDMTGDSEVTTLTHENGGTVNMVYNPDLQRLDVGTYSGKGGVFRMKSDLNEREAAGHPYADKVYIKDAAAGSKGLIQVHDKSFQTGHEVTGTKYQLLITDKSGKAKFSGMDLDEGGLWDVTPTIQNGKYVRENMGVDAAQDTEWYLTKLTRSINKDTIPLMKAADNSYALYRLDIDSLRKRMGDLRFRNLKDTSGIWARDFHGAYEGRGVDSRYNGFQLGYDYAANEKSIYGFFAERNISNPKYSYGSSKDHALSGGLYGTWFGDSGVYTDVVAKWGRDDTSLKSWGGYPDSANYRTWNESLSVEWGKTFTRDDGLFLEPQAQMVLGRLGSKDYTTSRGKTVHMGSYDSAIGRLGLLLGRRVTKGEHPYDYYLKFSLLHEFGGERNFHLAAPDGETMDYSEDYRDTWQEAGFGGTWHINDHTSLYADAERSFGGDWHKKWQWNVGINWQF